MSIKKETECEKYNTGKCYTQLLKDAVAVTNKDISEFSQLSRCLSSIDKFIASANTGIWVQDLPHIIQLVDNVYQKCSNSNEYISYLTRLLDIYCTPPMLKKTSDIMEYADHICQYFLLFGYMFIGTNNELILKTLDHGLNQLFNFKGGPKNCMSNMVLNKMLIRSQLPVLIADYMHMVDTKIYIILLGVVNSLMQTDETCRLFINKEMIDLIIRHLILPCSETWSKVNLFDYKLPGHFRLSLKTLWQLLQVFYLSHEKFKLEMKYGVTIDGFRKYHMLFKQLVLAKHLKKERNALHRLLITIANILPCAHDKKFQYDMISIAGVTENGTAGTWVSDIVFRNDIYDFEFKVMSLGCLCYCRAYPACAQIFHLRKTLLALLRILSLDVELIWTHAQRIKLMKCSLIAMERMMPFLLQDFLDYNAPKRLLKLCEDIINGHLPLTFLSPCLRCIHTSLLEGAHLEMSKKYRSKGTCDLFLSYIKLLIRSTFLTVKDQDNLVYIFCILQILNKGRNSSRECVVSICIECINRFLTPFEEDCFLDPKVMIAMFDFLWENLKLSEDNRSFFIQCGGVYLVLDVLEKVPLGVKLIALSLLVDLVEECDILPLLTTWRGHNGHTIITLLLNIFRIPNDVAQDGTWLDDSNPLMGIMQNELTLRRMDDPDSSPSCLDMLCSSRPKVYALFQMIQCSPLKEIIRDHYKVYNTKLNLLDEMTLTTMEYFLRLKILETWIEVKDDLERSGIRILTFDYSVIQFNIKHGIRLMAVLKERQDRIARKFSEQDSLKEKALYQKLRDQTLPDALSTIDELKMLANTMNPNFRKRAKNAQRRQLLTDHSTECGDLFNFHKTFMQDVNVTNTFEQQVSIRSNIVIDPNRPEDIPLVSPCDSNDNRLSTMFIQDGMRGGSDSFGTSSTESRD